MNISAVVHLTQVMKKRSLLCVHCNRKDQAHRTARHLVKKSVFKMAANRVILIESSSRADPPGMSEKMPRNVVSVDVEDYFHAEAFSDVVDRGRWDSYTSRVEANTRRLLELLATLNVHATFFVLGWVAERFPALVREIAASGHERVACWQTTKAHSFRW